MKYVSGTPAFDSETTWKFMAGLRCQEWIILDESLMKAQLQILIELSHQLPKLKNILLPCPAEATPNKIKPSQSSRLKIFSNVSKSRIILILYPTVAKYSSLLQHCFHTAQHGRCKLLHFRGIYTSLANCSRHKITFLKKLTNKLSKRMQIFRFLV